MTDIVQWKVEESPEIALRHLAEGRAIAAPTEANYEIVASALRPDVWVSLTANQTPAIAVLDYAELFDWLPRLGGASKRLFRKLGPGPVTMRADAGYARGLWSRLPSQAQRALAPDAKLAVRWPAHPFWTELRSLGLPLVTIPIAGGVNAEETAKAVGDKVACVIDGGPAQVPDVPTVVRAEGRRCVLEKPGALTAEQLDELTLCRALFVCTGNTCRSPLAEALCAKLIADAWGCTSAELAQRGFCVQSAGLAAMMGAEASSDAVVVAKDLGADLSHHRSRMITMEALLWADHVFGMTTSHCQTLESVLAEGLIVPRLLSPTFQDITDPIGGALVDYRTCAHQILACLKARLPELLES